MNPLAQALMWLGFILVSSLFFWFLIIKPIKYQKFKTFLRPVMVRQNERVVYNRVCQFQGARMVVFANQKFKQSFLNRLFTGRIVTYTDPVFSQRIEFKPRDHGHKALVIAPGYYVTPNPIPQNGVATISNNDITIQL